MAIWTAPTVLRKKKRSDALVSGVAPQVAPVVAAPKAPVTDMLAFAPQQPQTSPAPVVNPPPPAPNPDPMATETSNNTQNGGSVLFSNAAPGIGQGYTTTLSDALTGKIYDPMAAGAKEAQARLEANKRAGTAAQIASAGFSGTGIGRSIGSATENELGKQRFDTMIGIEQARNATRLGALGEARAYGSAEKSEAWKAYEQALATGSDSDVIAAFKNATGRDLDPAAVTQYRDYYRRGQEINLGTAQQTLETMRRTDSGTALSSYLATHLNSDYSTDITLQPMMQKYWESLGNTGPVPMQWAESQVKAARDVRVNTETGAFNYQLDQLVGAGQMTREDADLLKDFNTNGLTQFLKRDPVTGKVSFDYTALQQSTGGTAGPKTPESVASSFDPSVDDVWSDDAKMVLKSNNTDAKNALIEERANSIAKKIETDKTLFNRLKDIKVTDPEYKRALSLMNYARPQKKVGDQGKYKDPDNNDIIAKVVAVDTISEKTRLGGSRTYQVFRFVASDGRKFTFKNGKLTWD